MQVKTELNHGDFGYFMDCNQIQKGQIVHIQVNESSQGVTIHYTVRFGTNHTEKHGTTHNGKQVPEGKIFKVKEDLVKSLLSANEE